MTSASLHIQEQRIAPVRGLVPLHTAKGKPLPELDLRRWIRLNQAVFKATKIDLFFSGPIPGLFVDLLVYARNIDVGLNIELSARTDCRTKPDGLAQLKDAGLFDVCLAPTSFNEEHVRPWLESCTEHGLAVRMELSPPFDTNAAPELLAEAIAGYNVRAVDLTISPPFATLSPLIDLNQSNANLRYMNRLAKSLDDLGVEANLVGLPFCLTDESNWLRTQTHAQYFRDHQHYVRRSYELANDMYAREPWVITKIIVLQLSRFTSRGTSADLYLLRWLVIRFPYVHALLAMFRKLTSHMRILNRAPKVIEPNQDAQEAEVRRLQKVRAATLGPICGPCRLARICECDRKAVRQVFRGVSLTTQRGEACVSPMHFCREQGKYYDPIDERRRDFSQSQLELAKEANNVVTNLPASMQFGFDHYQAENAFSIQLPGAVQWYSLTNTEKISTVIARLDTPFTVSVTFGGGIAEQIGFSLGRHAKLVCPMEAFTHKLVLHADKDGNYVLLRDGVPVRPTEFEDAHTVPSSISTTVALRLSVWNVERFIYSQNLLVWEGNGREIEVTQKIKYSVIIVSMRFTRRLQAVLRAIAHQEGIDIGTIEIIVAYVPGIDATDDLISSVEMSFPGLRIVRSPFPERYLNAKGFVINESTELASGEWVVLIDSDILLPSDMFARIEYVPDEAQYVAPDRRKMLDRETTAKVLLGELEPWKDWDELMASPGETRVKEGIFLPIGFFQCVRAECVKKVKYEEYGHFQGADWDFIVAVRDTCGPGMWLEGLSVLHLDHGGSQWYGTQRHF